MTLLRSLALASLAAPLALGLSACGSKDSNAPAAAPTGGPVASVPPPAGKMWTDVVSATDGGGMRMGNPNAPIKVIEYGALSCPHCARLANAGMKTIEEKYVDSGRVSYEFRSFIIHGEIDVLLTQLVRCADPAAFFPLVEQLYATQEQWITVAEKAGPAAQAAQSLPPGQRMPALADAYGLTDWFASRGVSKDQAHACLARTDQIQAIAAQTQKWSTDDGIDQTPTIFINGAKTDIAEWAQLEPALQNAGAR